jgi:8-amino-7-oxononanoate synthase
METTAKKQQEEEVNWQEEIGNWTKQWELGGRDLFARAYGWQAYRQLVDSGLYPYFQPLDENQGPIAKYQGHEVLMLGSNNYLGLTTHPKVREAAAEAIRKYGTSMTGSRFLNGSMVLHEELEAKLASFLGKEAGLVFTTGYQANLGMLTALINKKAVAVVDRFAHASIHDGCRLMEGENIKFKHNDLEDLERVLASIPQDTGALLFVDGVYSMEGDLGPLPEMVKLAKKYKIRFAVDDAHGLGVMGPGGRGTCHYFGVEKDVDLIVGTFSKSLASIGGFVAGDRQVIDFIKHFGRPMIFSASLAPSCAAAANAALDILAAEPDRAETVRKNSQIMKKELSAMGYKTGNADAAIVPVVIGDSMMTFCIWKDLLDAGVYTNPVLYPAVAKGKEMLRTSYLATHTEEHLSRALEIFKKVGKNYGICS